ncbi:MAG: rhamnulokinase [Christensenellales bacterium]|jgi:rhamnulokinase
MKYYLIVDIGASSGRHMLGYMRDGKIVYEEIHRFITEQGQWKWHPEVLFDDIIEGMIKCRRAGKIPVSMGIDTFGVEHGLLDRRGKIIEGGAVLRDEPALYRTFGENGYRFMSPQVLYERTGIPDMAVGTVYQLLHSKERHPHLFAKAGTILPMPDFLNYLLTGVKKSEYSYATTTGLVNIKTHNWDYEIIEAAGLDPSMFVDLTMPGTFVGNLLPEIRDRVGFDLDVLQVASHDTASAYLAAPARDDSSIFISSGTWSLVGTESLTPVINEKSLAYNLSNEGNYAYRYRVLNCITGTLMLQRIRRDYKDRYSFPELAEMAGQASGFDSTVDVCDLSMSVSRLPMEEIIRQLCRDTGQRVPGTLQEVLACIYRSIAEGYAATVKSLRDCMAKEFTTIHLFSGGCRDRYLNQLTADTTGLPVYAGPVEAATIGNMLMQMLYDGTLNDLAQARALVKSTYDMHRIYPQDKST